MMTRWTTRVGVLALLLAGQLGQLGCSQGVNGAWSMDSRDEQAEKEYKQFKERQNQATAEAEQKKALEEQRVRFDGVNEQSAVAQADEEPTPQPRTIAEQSSDTGPAFQPRGTQYLLGELPQQNPGPATADSAPNFRQVTFASEGADFDPCIDPTGKWLAYASTQQRTTSDLFVKSVDGSTIRQLTDDPANEATPVFSPDGKWIAYATDRGGNWDICLISTDGGTPRQATNTSQQEIHPTFSPDGKRLAYSTRASQSGTWQLAVIDLDNPTTPRFIGVGLFPNWSPKEDKLVFQKPHERGSRYFGIWTVELENGEAKRPTLIAASSNAAAVSPRWSPDGQRIVFCTIINPESDLQRQGAPVQSDIWTINADGTGRANLTRSRQANLQPVWSTDGSVYFVSNRGKDGTESIWSVRTDAPVQVAQTNTHETPQTQETTEHPEQTAEAPTH